MRNWSGTVEYRATGVERPRSVDELRAVVARTSRIRALGTRHSFSDLADTDGVLVETTAIPPDIEVDTAARVVRIGAGTRYATLATHLTDAGWALHNLGSLPHISIGGAVATGTHGSGDANGGLATAVRGVQLVGPEGDLAWLRSDDPAFSGAIVALGLLGVVARIELAIEPGYLVRQDVYTGLPWDVLLADVGAITAAGYSVSVFTDWVTDPIGQVWVKRRLDNPGQPVPDVLAGAVRDTSGTLGVLEPADDNTTRQGIAGPWSAHLPHFRIESTPSSGDEIQSEYFVERADAVAALGAVRALGADIAPHLLITEMRTVARDDLWLSMAQRRDSLAIHFTWRNRPDDVAALLPKIEAALAPFAPRPHWGKVHAVPPEVLTGRYPRFRDFAALVARSDPGGKFGGPYTDALLAAVAA